MFFFPFPISQCSSGELRPRHLVFAFIAAVAFMWAVFTMFSWLLPMRGNPTLVDVLIGQWNYLATKRIW